MNSESLFKNEDLLVQWIIGFSITKTEISDSVHHLIKEIGRKNPFVLDYPGQTWFNAYVKQHANIRVRMAQNLTSSRLAEHKETRLWHLKR